jgi:transcriptional regulator with XRE-family HTH domain
MAQPNTKRIQEVIGERILLAREAHGRSQEVLGKQLAQYLGREWSRQAVHLAERGQREFVAAELVALAKCLGVHVAWLMVPAPTVSHVELKVGQSPDAAGAVIPARELEETFMAPGHLNKVRGIETLLQKQADARQALDDAMTYARFISEEFYGTQGKARR